ncbi:MAG: conjugal transfer protein TraO [Prevotellaceae bacterium]|jgi:hypothetical protein|nr:conjugal transfer protein TraO [Prevotellaceae bacterium]
MKRLIFILLTLTLCLVLSGGAYAQRYLHGQKGIQVTAGTVNGFVLDTDNENFAFHAGIAFSTYTQNGNRWVFGGEYLEKRYPYKGLSLPQSQFTAQAGYYLKFLSDGNKTLFFSLGVSLLAGYETVNWNEKRLFDGATIRNKDGFLYGGAITLEMEVYLTDWIALIANVRERLLSGSSVGKFNTQLGLGFKFIIY